MKKIKLLLSLVLLISISSCDEFLSETPDNRTEINTPEKISELLVDAYPDANYMDVAETMSDNVFDSGLSPSSLKNTQNYNWELQTETDTETQAYYWDACYRAIAHANKALEAIAELGDDSELHPQKGEALLARAYAHFMLVSLWSKRYNPATSSMDLGIPYLLEPETTLIKKYKRNTVKEVFDFIEKDIQEGLKYATKRDKHSVFHFSQEAGKAFASRFYLIKGDWDKVLQYSNDLGLKPDGKLRDYQGYTKLSFDTKRIQYASSSEPTNLLVISPSSSYWRASIQSRFYLSGARIGEILGSQTNVFNKSWIYEVLSYNGSVTQFVPKFYEYFKVTNATANIGETYTAIVLFSNDELYLNRIEALVMKNRISEANSELKYFLGLRTIGFDPSTDELTPEIIKSKYPVIANEFTPFYTLTDEQTSYIKAIAETRRRDFIHEGIRWFDVKRFDIEVKHEFTFFSGIKPNILVKGDNRRALQIPIHVSTAGLEKNPR